MNPLSLVKAFIVILPPDVASGGGGAMSMLTGGEIIHFQYNPDSYTMSGSASFPSTPVPSAPNAAPAQFLGTNPRDITVEIFLDDAGFPPRDVERDIKRLFACLTPHSSSLKGAPSPPVVIFGWGISPMPQFPMILTSVNVSVIRFGITGRAGRAKVRLSGKEILLTLPGTNPTSGSIDARSTHVVVEGDTLPAIAFREYRNPGLWRAIAEMNKIDDPMRLPSGTRLLIPSVEEAGVYA